MFYIKKLVFTILLLLFFVPACQHESPVEPNQSCIKNRPTVDTTHVYTWPGLGDTLQIIPYALFARFNPEVEDTLAIKQLIAEHNLEVWKQLFSLDQQWAAFLCVIDDKRAEYHFTPYGRENWCNFGADSLVEYAFGLFEPGLFNGRISFTFKEGTSETTIDSLFQANGLRLITVFTLPPPPRYRATVTKDADKNILDLTAELQSIPFIEKISLDFLAGAFPGGSTELCNKLWSISHEETN